MERPTPKKRLAIVYQDEQVGLIAFHADPNIVAEHCPEDFGELFYDGRYSLYIDKRFDFSEVVKFLESLA